MQTLRQLGDLQWQMYQDHQQLRGRNQGPP
jgi:hypothetical protein